MSVVPVTRGRAASTWQSFEAWVGTRRSGAALFLAALGVFALQSVVLPAYPGRDMGRYVQTYVQYWYDDAVLPSVLNTRGPLAVLGVSVPLELGGVVAEIWLAALYAASIVAWGWVALSFGPRAAILTTGLLLIYPGYGILFHGLASDALFAAAFAGWAILLTRAIRNPSVTAFLVAGLGMGALVLVRPPNQVLILFALFPLVLRAPWSRRIQWVAAFFVASAGVTQAWKAATYLRYGDAVVLRPSGAVLVVALALVVLLFPASWRRRLLLVAIPAVVVVAVAVAVKGVSVHSPTYYARSVAQGPPSTVFLFRTFEIDRIVGPDNGPASRELARAVQRELLTKEPYRSYGVDLDEFFASGSDRVFADMVSLSGVDYDAVTWEAIREHPGAFFGGIARTVWEQLWEKRVFAAAGATRGGSTGVETESSGTGDDDFVVVDGKRLPAPGESQPIPASHTGPFVWTLWGEAREVWRSATEHPLVFDDPRDERRYEQFELETKRLTERLPTRDANTGLVHRLNQASRAFPPLLLWLGVGIVALAVRRPERALVALAPAVAALLIIVGTSLVAFPVAEYAVPVAPAFVLLAAAGLVGADPRGNVRPPWRSSATE